MSFHKTQRAASLTLREPPSEDGVYTAYAVEHSLEFNFP